MTEKQETTYSMEQRTKLWAVGGGKGGVGKSFLTTNIGVLLAKRQASGAYGSGSRRSKSPYLPRGH